MWKNAVPCVLLVIFLSLVAHRVWRSNQLDGEMVMGAGIQLSETEERSLYLTPAGRYTQADIDVNGPALPSQRYRGFRARHDFSPLPGDKLCPISRTKANPSCTWIIDGHSYEFCCPPCIDELVRLAKEQPNELLPPSAFVKQAVPSTD
jgi:hypothetical protein